LVFSSIFKPFLGDFLRFFMYFLPFICSFLQVWGFERLINGVLMSYVDEALNILGIIIFVRGVACTFFDVRTVFSEIAA
jgi:hypothetical protein